MQLPTQKIAIKPRKLKDIVKAVILDAYDRHAGNIYTMRIELGISRQKIYRHLKAYGIKRAVRAFKRGGQ